MPLPPHVAELLDGAANCALKLCCPPPSVTASGEEWARWNEKRIAAVAALLMRAAEKQMRSGEAAPDRLGAWCRYQAVILLDAGLIRSEEHLPNDVQMMLDEGVVEIRG